jgi:hypothetical protein
MGLQKAFEIEDNGAVLKELGKERSRKGMAEGVQ